MLSQALTYDTLIAYTQAKFREVPPSEQLTRLLLRDLPSSSVHYEKIADIDYVVERAQPAVEAYRSEQPQLFKFGTDFITKSLGFVDPGFRAKHGFGKQTREAFPEYESLIAK